LKQEHTDITDHECETAIRGKAAVYLAEFVAWYADSKQVQRRISKMIPMTTAVTVADHLAPIVNVTFRV
jgi:hypothetical protein